MSNMAIDVKHGKCKEGRLDEKRIPRRSAVGTRRSRSLMSSMAGTIKVEVDRALDAVDIKHDSRY